VLKRVFNQREVLNFFGKSDTEMRKLSAADPTNIVNSCGENYLKSKNKPVSIRNEDNVLHLTSSVKLV